MKIRKKLHLSAKRCIFALLNDNLTIRVSFPRKGKALSILPKIKEPLWWLFYFTYFATKILKKCWWVVSFLITEMLFFPLNIITSTAFGLCSKYVFTHLANFIGFTPTTIFNRTLLVCPMDSNKRLPTEDFPLIVFGLMDILQDENRVKH